MIELIAIAAGAVLLLVLMQLSSRFSRPALDRAKYQKKWEEIKTLEHTSAAARRLAVIEADKLLDKALRELGISGETMGERLKSAHRRFSKIDTVWQAHRLRNQLVHEDNHPKAAELRRSLKTFEKALREIGAL